MRSLSLVSWNLHGLPLISGRRERFRRVAARVLDADADVVLFQEVWMHGDATQLARDLDVSYEPVPGPTDRLPGRASGLLSFVRRSTGWTIRTSRFHRFTTKAPACRAAGDEHPSASRPCAARALSPR